MITGMGWMRSAGAWLVGDTRPRPAGGQRVIQSFSLPIPASVTALYATDTAGGGEVGRDVALSIPAVLRGRNLLCSISTLPLSQIDKDNRPQSLPFFEQIDDQIPNVVTLAMTVEDLVFRGVAWWQITARDGAFPAHAQHVSADNVTTQDPSGRNPNPLPYGQDPRGATVWVNGVETPTRNMIQFLSPNPGVLSAAARAIRTLALFERTSALYADNPRPQDYFTPDPDAGDLDDDEQETFLDKWWTARKKGLTAWLPKAAKYNVVDSPSPADLQLVELKKQAYLELANALGLDPEDLGVSTTSRTYQNATDRRKDKINEVFAPYMRALTDRLSMPDVTKRGKRAVFDLDDYLKADPITRWTVYEKGLAMGVISEKEVRAKEGLTPDVPPKPKPAPVPVAAGNVVPIRPEAQAQ
jgi:hypothetical protein